MLTGTNHEHSCRIAQPHAETASSSCSAREFSTHCFGKILRLAALRLLGVFFGFEVVSNALPDKRNNQDKSKQRPLRHTGPTRSSDRRARFCDFRRLSCLAEYSCDQAQGIMHSSG